MIRTLLFAVIFISCSLLANAQLKSSDNTSPIIPDSDKKTVQPGSPEDELLQRAAIRREEEAHREMLIRAQESAQLGSQLRQTFQKQSALTANDKKTLERIEKLAKKIRGNAGGSGDHEPQRNLPNEVGAAVQMLAEAAEDLQKKVEKTSRLVTSAAVVQRSNEVIELAKHIRTFFR